MNLLDRYLLTQFVKNLLLVLGSLITVYLLVDFFERVDNFSEAGKTIGLAVKYLLLKVPIMYDQLIPVCILLAGVLTLGILNHSHELLALKAGGICATRIIRPLLVGAVIFTILTLAAAQWLLPPAVAATNRIWYEEVQHKIPKGINRNGRTYYRGREGIYSFYRSDPNSNRFQGFSYARWNDRYGLQFLLTSRVALWENNGWHFIDGQIKEAVPEGGYRMDFFDERSFPLPEGPEDFFLPVYKIDELSLSQMYEQAKSKNQLNSRVAWLDFNRRLSYIFLGLPLLLIGLPVLLIIHQRGGRDLALAVPVSCGLAFVAWGWWSATQSLAKAAYIHPAVASWSIHLLVSFVGFYLIRRQDT